MELKFCECVEVDATMSANEMAAAPTCVRTAYHTPALRTLAEPR